MNEPKLNAEKEASNEINYLDQNISIALFLNKQVIFGLENIRNVPMWARDEWDTSELRFEKNYEVLMWCIDKIESMGFKTIIAGSKLSYELEISGRGYQGKFRHNSNRCHTIWTGIVSFITWHNGQVKQHKS